MSARVERAGLQVADILDNLLVNDIIEGTGISIDHFWQSAAAVIAEFMPENKALLAKRDDFQAKIDAWHQANPYPYDQAAYLQFLKDIGYWLPEPDDFNITTENVDEEIATMAGPQLVVPVMNAR